MSIALAALLATLVPQDEIFSGPQKGEKTAGFTVFDIDTRKEVDYVSEWNGAPTVIVFIHELTRPGFALMRPIDRYAQMKGVRGLKIVYVSLADDRDQAERHLPVVKKSVFLRSPLAVSVDGKEGPGAYGLNREVTLTILVAKDNKVHGNFAILSPNETDYPKVKKAIDEVLATETAVPSGTTEELAREVARLREENLKLQEDLVAAKIDAERSEMQLTRMRERSGRNKRMMRRPAQPEKKKEDPNAKPPRRGNEGGRGGAAERDDRLVGMMRGLIQKTATPEGIAGTVKRIEAYLAEKPALKAQYVDILGRIVQAGYGTEHAQTVIKQQLEKHSK